MDFDNKVVIVTGAGGSFGREGAAFFAAQGGQVALVDFDAAALKASVDSITSNKLVKSYICDITDENQVKKTVDLIAEDFGVIDCLWNNAGYQGEMQSMEKYPLEDFSRVMNINVVGSFSFMQAVSRRMIQLGTRGSIVNTASVAALRGTPTMCAYVASKAALIGLTISVAKDLAPFGIRVNTVSPALIGPGYMWDRQNELHAASGSIYFDSNPEVVARNKVNSVPLKRLGSVEEVVNAVAFLLSDKSSYTTGSNLVVSGGLG